MKQIFFILLITTNLTFAFTFEGWTSNMSLDEAIKAAERKNIGLHKPELIVSPNVSFSYKYLQLKEYPHNRKFEYETTFMDRFTKIALYFTQSSRRLYSVEINWHQTPKDFASTVYMVLNNKYKQVNQSTTSNLFNIKSIFYKNKKWIIDINNIIWTRKSSASFSLKYIDLSLLEVNKKEVKNIKETKKQKMLIRDAYKL